MAYRIPTFAGPVWMLVAEVERPYLERPFQGFEVQLIGSEGLTGGIFLAGGEHMSSQVPLCQARPY